MTDPIILTVGGILLLIWSYAMFTEGYKSGQRDARDADERRGRTRRMD